jgi:outer membrane protein, heavy metal efflux system
MKFMVSLIFSALFVMQGDGYSADSGNALPTGIQAVSSAMLDSLVAEALSNNPRIRSSREGSAAARERVGQATALEPPLAAIEFFQTPVSSFPNPLRNGQENDYSLQQELPFPGKKAAMGRSARAGVSMAVEGTRSLERQIAREVKAAYYSLYFARRTLAITVKNRELLRDLIEITTKRYEVGGGGQADILRAQTELSRLATETMRQKGDIRVAEAALNTVLGRQAGSPFGEISAIERDIPDLTIGRLDSLAAASRPELKGMEYGVKMNEAELTVAEKEKLPDFMLRLMYKDMTMTRDFWSSMVGVTIPQAYWSRKGYESRIREAHINIRRARADYENMRNMVFLDVHNAYETLRADREVVLSYRTTLIPQAEQTLESTIAAYRAGTADFLMVIDSARMLLETRRDYEMGITRFMTSQADLEFAVGMEMGKLSPVR